MKATTLSSSRGSLARRAFHAVVASTIAVLGLFLSREVMLCLLGALVALAVATEMARFVWPGFNSVLVQWFGIFLKGQETRKVTAATYLAMAALICFILFHKQVAVSALLFTSLGDPAAALVGGAVKGPRIWGKSPVGTIAFFVMSLGVVGVLVSSGAVDYQWALLAGAGVAAVTELLPLPIDDNVSIPLVGGVSIAALGMGWAG